MVGTQESRLPYFPALDGIRALAVGAVLAFHGEQTWASGGYLGVSTFFTLSGFLITSLLLAEHHTRGSIQLVPFWTRRFRRLMPAALLALLGIAIYGALAADPSQIWRLRADALSALFYVANWRFMLSGRSYEEIFGRPSPVMHFWSLSIEEQFYVFYPLLLSLLLLLARGSRARLFGSIALLAAGSAALMALLYEPEHPISRVYYGTDTRAAELLIGALLAIAIAPRLHERRFAPSPATTLLGGLGLAASVFLWHTASPASLWLFEGGLALYALASAALVAGALFEGPVQRALSLAPLRWLGRISYGLYLYHWPLYLWLDGARTGLAGPSLLALRLGTTIVVSTLSYYALELPIRRGRWLPGARIWVSAPAAMGVVALALIAVTRNPVVPPSLNHPFLGRRPMPERTAEPGRGPVRGILFGDSVAWTLGNGLASWGSEGGRLELWNLATYGCGLTDDTGAFNSDGQSKGTGRCRSAGEWWAIQLKAFEPDVVYVMAGLWDLRDRRLPHWSSARGPGDPLFDDWLLSEFDRAVGAIAASDARILWLTYPCISPSPGANVMGGPLGNTSALEPERLVHLNTRLLPRLAARHPDRLELVDFSEMVCPDGAFRDHYLEIRDARPDGVHFSKEAARSLAEALGPLALQAR